MTKQTLDRRGFIKLSLAGIACATAGVGMASKSKSRTTSLSSEGEEGAHSWAMVIDMSKCTGCGHCTLACRAYNDVSPDISWTRVEEMAETVDGRDVFMPIPCMHCEDAPCVHVCPVGANSYRSDGIVMMDYDKCIGCRYCQIACPYGARSFNWEEFTDANPAVPAWGQPEVARRPRGVPEKCSFCYQRIDRGLSLGLTPGVDTAATPACVNACPMKARIFGDLNDPESLVSKALAGHTSFRLREELGTGPRVYYLPADVKEQPEEANQCLS